MDKIDAIEVKIKEVESGYNSFLGKHFKAYRASDVDTYRVAVKARVEAIVEYVGITAKVLDGKADKPEAITVASNLKQAIAAVERLEG